VKYLVTAFALATLLIGSAGCEVRGTAGERPISVAVSIAPQADIVRQVGGDRIAVTVLLPAGQSPELYDPSPRLMTTLSEVSIYFMIGFPFETKLARRFADSYSSVLLVDIDGALPRRIMEGHGHGTAEHAHGNLDSHTWLDPIRVKTQAEAVCRTLSNISPADSTVFNQNLTKVQWRLDSLDHAIRARLEKLPVRNLYVFHPAFGYFTDRYGLEQIAVESEGKEPSARQLAQLLEQSKGKNVRALFIQPQFSQKTARSIADALGCRIVTLDPLAPEYFENLGAMAGRIAEALSGEPQTH